MSESAEVMSESNVRVMSEVMKDVCKSKLWMYSKFCII